MSRMRSVQKPPLPKSPIRLRPRWQALQPTATTQSPPGSLAKSLKPNPAWAIKEELEMRPEYLTISCELRALANQVREELGNAEREEALFNSGFCSTRTSSNCALFERGRFYDEYSARRNERLKRKKGQTGEEGGQKSACYNLGVTVESAKRSSSKRLGSFRKSISSVYYSAEKTSVSEAPRYLLRSMSKENKKPPLPVVAGDRKVGARRVRKMGY